MFIDLEKFNRNDLITPIFLSILVILSRLPLTSKFLYEWDSASYALALEKYDILHQQPHPPGYILYVGLGKIVKYIFQDANMSLIFLSVFFSILTIILVYFLAKNIFNRKVAVAASILLTFNPLFWFYGEISSIYIFESFFAVLIAYLSYKVVLGDGSLVYPSALALGLAGGFRIDIVEFMFPLWLFCLWYSQTSYTKIIKAFIILFLSVMIWFIPTILLSGGLGQYLQLLTIQSEASTYTSMLFGASISQQILNSGLSMVWSMLALTLFGLVVVVMYLVYHRKGWRSKFISTLKNPINIFFLLWVMPAFLFYSLVYIIKPGYTLVYLPAFMIILGYLLSRLADDLNTRFFNISPRSTLVVLILMGFILNSMIYLYPYDLHEGELWETPMNKLDGDQMILFALNTGLMYNQEKINANDQNTKIHIQEILKLSKSDPNTTIVVIRDITREDEGFNWRKAMYYLPAYNVYYLFDYENSGIKDRVSVWHGQNHADDLTKSVLVEIPLKQSTHRIIWIMNNQSAFYREVQSKVGVHSVDLPNGLKIYYSDILNDSLELRVSGFIFKR